MITRRGKPEEEFYAAKQHDDNTLTLSAVATREPRCGRNWWIGAALVAAVAWITLGPSPRPAATAAVIDVATSLVIPPGVTDMKVTEPVRLAAGRIRSIDVQPIRLEEYGSDRLDPRQEATESLEVDFPAETPKAKKLKQIYMDEIHPDLASDSGHAPPHGPR